MAITDKYDVVIGLEVHCQLKTESKLFCSCLNRFGRDPNDNTCPVCLGMPGTLPVLNRKAVDFAIKLALAIGAKVAPTTKFDRKHYFYPDLPKGYQISQYDEPYCTGGGLAIRLEDGREKFIHLTRIHMEEDAGKLSHSEDSHIQDSIVDLNRAGTPLLEIVTEPCLQSSQEAAAYLAELKQILEYIEVSDCNMQEGSLRCDANVSLKPKGAIKLGTKVEIKNMNSFKGVAAAIEHEIRRQYFEIESGRKIIQETRLYDVDRAESKSMRTKEDANDYRYFPEPDLPRLNIDPAWIQAVGATMVELPQQKKLRFAQSYKLSDYDIGCLTAQRDLADYFESCAAACGNFKEICNWMMGEIQRELGERKMGIREFAVQPQHLVEMIRLIDEGKITKKIAKDDVFPEMVNSTVRSAQDIVMKKGLVVQSDDDSLLPVVLQVLEKNPKAIADIKAGKLKAMGALVGQCMKETRGKADPAAIGRLIEKQLKG